MLQNMHTSAGCQAQLRMRQRQLPHLHWQVLICLGDWQAEDVSRLRLFLVGCALQGGLSWPVSQDKARVDAHVCLQPAARAPLATEAYPCWK